MKSKFSVSAFTEYSFLVPAEAHYKQCVIFLYLVNIDLVNNLIV
jgi:hypothetical protein